MELLELIGAGLQFCGLDIVIIVADFIAWLRSRPNRRARRDARRQGTSPPRATGWTIAFWVLTPIVVILILLGHRARHDALGMKRLGARATDRPCLA